MKSLTTFTQFWCRSVGFHYLSKRVGHGHVNVKPKNPITDTHWHSIVRDLHTVLTLTDFVICCIQYASSRFISLPITNIMDYYTNRLDERTRPDHCYRDTVPVGVASDMDHIIWCLSNSPKNHLLVRTSMTVHKNFTSYGGLKYRSVTKTSVCPGHGSYVCGEDILQWMILGHMIIKKLYSINIVDLDENFRPLKMLFSYKWLIVKKSLGKYNFLYCGASLWGPETLHFFSHTKKFYLNTQRSNNEVNFWSDTDKDIWRWNSNVWHTYIKF